MKINVQLLAVVWILLSCALRATALEVNYWPVFTSWSHSDGAFQAKEMVGPVIFQESKPAQEIRGVRPLFVQFDEKAREAESFHVLYPLFNVRERPYGFSWDVLTLVRYQSFFREHEEPSRTFHAMPFIFWHREADPEKNYTGLFPIAGSVRSLLGYDRISWVLFPLTGRFEKGEVTTVAAPWPFLRWVKGPETDGFHVWPLYGQVSREGQFSHRYWLWPLGYSVQRGLSGETPTLARGFLPFYASTRSANGISRSYIWPFFGYTDSWEPDYHERRYFWPLFVQRRGASYINRWAPFYTHSIRRDQEKRWILWPFYRNEVWDEQGLRSDRTQFLYFLYWSQTQTSIANPELDPAVKRHVWPFYSYWDNGAGRKQFQALSPFEVFFPFNDVVRANYSPLFALYRMDVEEGIRSRHSFLFNFITTNRQEEEETWQVDVGPLFSFDKGPGESSWTILKGLISRSRENGDSSWGIFWMNRPDGIDDSESATGQLSHE